MVNKRRKMFNFIVVKETQKLKINRTQCLQGSVEMSALMHHEYKYKLTQVRQEGALVESNVCTLNVCSFYTGLLLLGLSPTEIMRFINMYYSQVGNRKTFELS